MKKITSAVLIVVFVFTVFSLQSCSLIQGDENVNYDDKSLLDVPLYRNAKRTQLQPADAELMKTDFFGYEQTLYPNALDVRVTDDMENEIIDKIEDKLINDNWRYEYSLLFDVWRKGDLVLFLLIDDNLSSDSASYYHRSYGIDKLKSGQTLIATYVMDSAAPLPNPTMTSAAQIWNSTMTADAVINTQRAIEYQQQNTQQAVQETQQVMSLTQESYVKATQAAIEEAQRIQSMQFTATAIKPILDSMGSEFDGGDSIPPGMTIAREDPTRWDLTSKPGWLHISGRYVTYDDENWITKNAFVYPLENTNISIITRVDAEMNREGQSVWLALTPRTYETNGYTMELGISLNDDTGREVYAWGCMDESCSFFFDFDISDAIRFSGPVYLRIDMQELLYTFYYSENGENWIYLGEYEGASAGDNLVLAAGGGYQEEVFDAYFDFIRFSAIAENK